MEEVVVLLLVLVLFGASLATTLVEEEPAELGIPGVLGRDVDIARRRERKPERMLSWAVGKGRVGWSPTKVQK